MFGGSSVSVTEKLSYHEAYVTKVVTACEEYFSVVLTSKGSVMDDRTFAKTENPKGTTRSEHPDLKSSGWTDRGCQWRYRGMARFWATKPIGF